MNQNRRELANALRALSMDAVQKANSGHPGAPMGMADIAEVLWRDFHKHDPSDPLWPDRDRFVLSNGHGSMLLYSLLHLTGYDLSIEELKNFRKLHSKTPGHPEYGLTPGVETTTGPLGQGLANAVGMALAEKKLAAEFNKPGHEIVNHNTWVFAGDGCLMEGVSHEVCALAGVLGLGKLILFYDQNGISIDGEVGDWFAEDVAARFDAYGWQTIQNVDGHDSEAIAKAIILAKSDAHRPSLICCKTQIGFGSPNKAGTAGVHGAPLGEEEIAATRKMLGWADEPFVIPDGLYQAWDGRHSGSAAHGEWLEQLKAYREEHPYLAKEYERRMAGELPRDWLEKSAQVISDIDASAQSIASRQASQNAIEGFAASLPELLGGSADLTDSNKTDWSKAVSLAKEPAGNYLSYGVREFGMSAMMNGMALHGGVIPFGGTFLVFSDYARNAVRMAALMGQRVLFVYTHDSIGLGEDGPTHQPVEHLASLRLIPNLNVWRPCDAVESAVAWQQSLERREGPTALIFSRQKLSHQVRSAEQIKNIARGGYVLMDGGNQPRALIVATGSEVELATQAANLLSEKGIPVRVVSMPSSDVFDQQPAQYRLQVLPSEITRRVSVEAGVTSGWQKYTGDRGVNIGLDRFGESAPAGELFDYFGIGVEQIVAAVESSLGSN